MTSSLLVELEMSFKDFKVTAMNHCILSVINNILFLILN